MSEQQKEKTARLLNEYGDQALRLCLCMLLNEQQAQAAMLDCFASLPKGSGQGPERQQVLEAAMRACMDRADNAGIPPACKELCGGILLLPFRHRAVVMARYYVGLSPRRAARLLHVSELVFRFRLARACAALKQQKS